MPRKIVKTEEKTPITPWFIQNWIAFFVLGLVNNLSYVVVGSAAQNITNVFNVPNLIGLIPWANIAFGFVVQITNGFLLEKMPHLFRIIAFCVISAIGLIGVAVSVFIGFPFALIAIIFVGASSAFGESVMLGYMKLFPPNIVSGWSSGTGMAGLGGSLLYLTFQTLQLSMTVSFLLLVPLSALYFVMFKWVLKPPVEGGQATDKLADQEAGNESEESTKLLSPKTPEETYSEKKNPVPTTQETGAAAATSEFQPAEEPVEEPEESPKHVGLNDDAPEKEGIFKRYIRVFKFCWWRAFNLLLVYLFEYVISIGCANKSQPKNYAHSDSWAQRNAFVILAFCYSIGVIISRSSLPIIKIRQIEWITIFQGLNLLIWLYNAKTRLLGVWLQFPMMIFVGLLGGASYVNVYYLLLQDKRVNAKDRELAINMTAIGVTIGITSASICMLILDNTFLK